MSNASGEITDIGSIIDLTAGVEGKFCIFDEYYFSLR